MTQDVSGAILAKFEDFYNKDFYNEVVDFEGMVKAAAESNVDIIIDHDEMENYLINLAFCKYTLKGIRKSLKLCKQSLRVKREIKHITKTIKSISAKILAFK